MLRDLFFSIWFDNNGDGWFVLVSLLFLITLAMLIFIIFRTKLKKEKFKTGHKIFFIIAALIMYQIVPICFHIAAAASLSMKSYSAEDYKNEITLEKLAIKTSVIPWQKGGYYCCLADFYLFNKDLKNVEASLNEAYKYVKSYKYPCWGMHWSSFELLENYDAAIEVALNLRIKGTPEPGYGLAAGYYIQKGDLNNAMKYLDKEIELKGENAYNLAMKAYILKEIGNTQEAEKLYVKAFDMCKDDEYPTRRESVKAMYTDYAGYLKSRQERAKKNYVLK